MVSTPVSQRLNPHRKQGDYVPILVLENTHVDPGHSLSGYALMSGYGSISNAKLLFEIPDSLFVKEKGEYGADIIHNGQYWVQGSVIDKGEGTSYLKCLDNKTFLDMPGKPLGTIWAEGKYPSAPFTFRLPLKSDCKAGAYRVVIVLTYYDGESWRAKRDEVSFVVRSVFQRHEHCVASLALIAAIGTILTAIPTAYTAMTHLLTLLR